MTTLLQFEMELTGIVVSPFSPGEGYFAFFAQFPEAIAYAPTADEAQENLIDIFF